MTYYLILPEEPSPFLGQMIANTLGNTPYKTIRRPGELGDLTNKKILFALELPISGESSSLNDIFQALFERGKKALENSSAAVLIHSKYELFTKTAAQNLIFRANLLGCSFVGRPLVEATGSLNNLIPLKKVYKMEEDEICLKLSRNLGRRFIKDKLINKPPSNLASNIVGNDSSNGNTDSNSNPNNVNGQGKIMGLAAKDKLKVLALHSSIRATSNTLLLWDMVKSHLDMDIREINLGNGQVVDCKGCPYRTCKYFGQEMKCFYGGIIVEEVYPAILEADILVFICPNYNDMLGANIVALINRLTALYRKVKFYDKTIFALIVSGHSGGDALAKQLISSLNINKTFRLPPYFALMATANDKGAILQVPHIEDHAREFAEKITALRA